VIIVDDGSTDETPLVAGAFASLLPLRYVRQRNAGLASAKNHGLYVSRAPIVLFLDDDDIAHPTLLAEHLATHAKYPAAGDAVLGYTRLHSAIARDPLMHFVTEVGFFLFSYPNICDGDVLDFEYFWGGRSSCKRSLLIDHGVFNPVFRFGCEDIELGYRLSSHGLRVIYDAGAVLTMVRRATLDELCNRLVRQGRSNRVFSELHRVPAVHRWTERATLEERWKTGRADYESLMAATRALDDSARQKIAAGLELPEPELAALHEHYYAALGAAKARGFCEAV
jgi:glycosyltransferase involved in cell wall biosynthesis